MRLLSATNRFISLFLDTFRQFGRWRIWLLLLAYFLLEWLVLYALYDFIAPPFYTVVRAWARLFGDQQATGFFHYPGHFLILPYFFDWAKFCLGAVFEGAVLGGVALVFHDSFLEVDRGERSSLKLILRSWAHLVVGWLLLNGLMLAAALVLPGWLESWLEGNPRRILAFQFGLMPAIYVVLLALFYFMIPAVAVFRENVLQALGRSLAVFFRNPFTCLFLAVSILIGPILVSVIAGRPDIIVEKLRPEMVYLVLLGGLVIEVFVNFFWMGTAVRFLVDEEE